MAEIVPTILTSDFNDFTEKISLVREVVPRVQIDVVDGKFAPRKTVPLEGMRGLTDMKDLRLDLHLMVEKPEDWVSRSLELLPDRIIGHIETMSNPRDFIDRAIEGGVEAGLALDLETPVEVISDEVYHLADLILVLGVKAGIGGQEFEEKTLKKIERIREVVGDLVKIGVDGGLNEENIPLCKSSGAEIFYVGGSFWEARDLGKRYNELLGLISNF